jgi:hypothetical protein
MDLSRRKATTQMYPGDVLGCEAGDPFILRTEEYRGWIEQPIFIL